MYYRDVLLILNECQNLLPYPSSDSLMIHASHPLTRCTLDGGNGLGFSVGWLSFAETSSAFRISSEGHTLTLTCCVRLADFRCWTGFLQKLVTPFQQFGFSEDTFRITSDKIRVGVWPFSCFLNIQERPRMRYVVSVSYQAVKSRVYRLIDSLAEEGKTTNHVKDSLKQWWNTIHPSDRPVARKYLIAILAEANSGIDAIREGIATLDDFGPHPTSPFALSRLHPLKLDLSSVSIEEFRS